MSGYGSLPVKLLSDYTSDWRRSDEPPKTQQKAVTSEVIDTRICLLVCVYASLLVGFSMIVIISRRIRRNVVDAHLVRTHRANSCMSNDFVVVN